VPISTNVNLEKQEIGMTKTRREQLFGSWKLVSYVEKPTDGSEPFYPLGEHPQGIIMYTPDGYMYAQLQSPGRPPFASDKLFKGTTQEIKKEAPGSPTPARTIWTRRSST
jgi:hypothetical protein